MFSPSIFSNVGWVSAFCVTQQNQKNISTIICVGFYVGSNVKFQNPKLAEYFVGENICWVTQKTLTQPTLLKSINQVRSIKQKR
jgi:hypothetical protein